MSIIYPYKENFAKIKPHSTHVESRFSYVRHIRDSGTMHNSQERVGISWEHYSRILGSLGLLVRDIHEVYRIFKESYSRL